MMKAILIAAATILQAYLLGSVDTGILVSKFVYHDDVRNHGSGAAGMTNMLRTFGKKAAAMTATGDVLKGVLAVCRFPTQRAVGRGCAIPLQNKEVLSNEGQTIDSSCTGSSVHAQRGSNAGVCRSSSAAGKCSAGAAE